MIKDYEQTVKVGHKKEFFVLLIVTSHTHVEH